MPDKKNKTISMRLSPVEYAAYKEKAALEGKTVTALMEKVMGAYVREDVTMQSQMLAASARMQEELSHVRKEIVILYNMVDSLVYSLFCAFPAYFSKEFEDDAQGSSRAVAASQNRRTAEKLKEDWTRKLLRRKGVSLSVLSNSMDEITKEE